MKSNLLFAGLLVVALALGTALAVPPPHRRSPLGHVGNRVKRDDAPPPPPPCTDPVGWNWAHFASQTTSDGESTFDVPSFKTAQPEASGVTSIVGFNYGYVQNVTFYDDPTPVTQPQFFVVHHAYLRVPISGVYTFNLKADNIALVWIGSTAVRGWTRANNFLENVLPIDTLAANTAELQQDTYVAVRVALLNTSGPSLLALTITGPDAKRVPDDAFVQFACLSDSDAPPFPAWGEEQ